MNRSVISVTIAAGVLFPASGIVTAAVAVAEPAQPVASNDADPGPGGAGGTTRGPRNPGRGGKPSADGAALGRPTADALSLWPCLWPVIPPVSRPDTQPEAGGGGGGVPVGLSPIVAPVAPQARISGGVERAVPDLPPIEALPEPSETLPAPAVSGPIVPPPVLAPARSVQPPPFAAPPKPAGPATPAAPAPPPQRAPVGGAVPPAAVPVPPAAVPDPPSAPAAAADPGRRLGDPEALRTTDATALATSALPGLAVILAMTAVGALVGYRQAKAGSVLRAAGAGRFLR